MINMNVSKVSLGELNTGLLYNNKTVEIRGNNSYGQSDMTDKVNENIEDIQLGGFHSAIVYNGNSRIVVFGLNKEGQCDIKSFKN